MPQKPHRLLPTNLYVVLYNFEARHQDELDLKAGYKVRHGSMDPLQSLLPSIQLNAIHRQQAINQVKEVIVIDHFQFPHPVQVTVIDTSDPDWWKGKCLGRIGYFPSKYCARLAGGEKPLQVTHNLQVSDNERPDSTMTLLRDQIVIQVRGFIR